MKKLVLSFICAFMATLAIAQESATKVLTANNVVSASSSFEATKGTENFINFEVEAMEAGDYYAEFWLLPAEYADGSFTTFKVYVNFKYVGSITTDRGNWQTAAVDDLPALKLNSGKNYISVSTEAPECPQVETVRLSKSAQAAKISSAEYDAYLEKAINSDGTPETVASITPMSATIEEGGTIIPLRYSFYKDFYFEKDQEIFITSSSNIAHDIDLFITHVAGGQTGNIDLPTSDFPQVSIGDNPPIDLIPLRFANPDEQQGINWIGESEKAVNDPNTYVATIRATIPKSGKYMIKLRSADKNVIGHADLNVNGTYFYNSAPMFYSYIDCEMPADGNNYVSYAKANIHNESCDPMLFVESKLGDKVVAYDNGLKLVFTEQQKWGLKDKDAFINRVYKFPTKRLHVSNSKSVVSLAYFCTVKGGILYPDNEINAAQAPARDKETTNAISGFGDLVTITPEVPDVSTSITISSKERIKKVEAYTLSGTKTADHDINSYSATIPLQELGINSNGLYIISVETESGKVSQKMLVK